ncbi:hypothetical protein ACIBP6_33660 [Nonomuraea terrae]
MSGVPAALYPADLAVGNRGSNGMSLFICLECPQRPVEAIDQ